VKGGLGLLGAVLCMIAVACAASRPQKAAAPAATGGMEAPQRPEIVKPLSPQDDEIEQLARDLEAKRVELGLPTEPGCAGATCAQTPEPLALVQPTAECRPQTETCKQSCTLSDSICENSKKICDLAGQLAGDAWAAKKCTDGNTTCTAAKAKCCKCTS